MWRFRFLGLLVLSAASVSVAAFPGCGSSSDGPAGPQCDSSPFQCATGTTCSVKTCDCAVESGCSLETCTPVFDCLPSLANGVEGASCSDVVGMATCDDGLACI